MNDAQAPGKRIGKGMLAVSWIIILVGLTAFFGSKEKSWYNPNQTVEGSATASARTVTLERNRQHHYVATGEINGHKVTFLLDTGATNVSVPAQIGRKLGLRPGERYTAATANGLVEVRGTNIRELKLGPIVLEDVNASLNPGMNGDEILLGMSALKTLDFSQSGSTLTLTQYLN